MRTLQIRHYRSLRSHVSLFAGNAAAQDKSPAILNSLEVQQLVKRAEPGDNARLAAHFTALADSYAAEAKRHTSMSTAYTGNARAQMADRDGGTCKQLADLNTQSATELRELATYHQKLAAGAAATPPTQLAPASKAVQERLRRPIRSSRAWLPRRARPQITTGSRSTT